MDLIKVTIFPDGRMDTENTARYLGVTVGSLATMRSKGHGPRYIKKGRIFYFKDALDEWLNSSEK